MTVEIPTKDEHRAAWAALTMADRRRIMRSVTKGVAVEDRRHAKLAIGAAQQQKFFWKWAWGLGPLLGVVLIDQGWQVVAFNIVLSTGLIVALSRWRWLRADRCQRANLELLEGPARKKRKPKRKSHLPTDPGKPTTAASPDGSRAVPAQDVWPGDQPNPNTSKAKLKRRRKRR